MLLDKNIKHRNDKIQLLELGNNRIYDVAW